MKLRVVLPLLALAIVGTVLGTGASGAVGDALRCGPFARPCAPVLFVGNSYTYENDLPDVFARLASAGGHGVRTAMLATGGATLADHVAASETAPAIANAAAGFVILQEQSEIPAAAPDRESVMYPAVRALVADARNAGAVPLLLATWAHLDGWPERGLDHDAMQSAIDAGYGAIGRELGVAVAPVGDAFRSVHASQPSIALWSPDGSHPTPSGTYLAACVLYGTLFGASPVGLGFTSGLDAATARALQAAAAEASAAVH